MRKLNILFVILAFSFLLLLSCSSPKIVFDYDKEANFNLYKTFDFYPGLILNMSELDSTRVISQIESALLLKGFKKATSPDVFVNILAEQFETPSNNSVGIGIGTGGRNVGVGVSGGIPIRSNSLTQLFKVDLIDVSKDILIWQGTYEGRFRKKTSPEAKEEYYKITFAKIFEGYPPK